MKRTIFVCLLAACALLAACSKDDEDYGKYFVGRYTLAVNPQITEGAVNVSPSAPLTYVMTIDKAGEDSLMVRFDSTYSAMGYADAEGLHVNKLSVKQNYKVNISVDGSCPFSSTLNFMHFVMPRPLSNGTNQLSRFTATTTGTGTIDRVTNEDLVLNAITGTSVFSAVMTNDPNVIIVHDTNAFPAKILRQ